MKRIEDRIRRLEQGEPALSGAGQPEWEVG